ncbi:hypothetical protein HOB10_03135 [Candidatus Parcubacteria bacterium]|jgi:hypothetical protein|nr:hypothetical protein [Candidatus Parcubacteria bacterium]
MSTESPKVRTAADVDLRVEEILEKVETELQYWEIIESIGGFVWRMNHDMGHGRIEDKDGQVSGDVAFMQRVIEKLVTGLFEKYGVIHPKNCPKVEFGETPPAAPEGTTYYWDWYDLMKQESYSQEYNGMICAACPYSKGLDYFKALGGNIPCGLFPGSCFRLRTPFACCMIGEDRRFEYTMEEFLDKLQAEHEPAVLAAFTAHHLKLQDRFAQNQQQKG